MAEVPNGTTFEVPGYQVHHRIGRGGFAVVYEAEQLSLGRAVALKMLMPEHATDRDVRRFERERLLLSELSRHRHVVDVIDAGTTAEGVPFIVMRLYRRGSLAQALADSGPMRPADVVAMVGKLAGALQAAHNLGVVHRDVKPENVLIAEDGEPALADFGISVLTGPDRTTTGNFFSMGHVAPEVLSTGTYGVASDVYSLASTTYMLLTGRYAFTGPNQFVQMRAIVEGPVPPIGRGDVPPAMEAVVVRGMAKRPEDRYPSTVEFADALAAAWQTATASVAMLPGFPGAVPADGGAPRMLAAPVVPAPPATTASSGVRSLFGPAPGGDRPLAASPAAARTDGGRRRRGAIAAAVTVALGIPALLGATYALDVPPGSALRSSAQPAPATPVVLVSALSRQGFADGDNPTNTAIDLYLSTLSNTVGTYRVTLDRADVATPRWTGWDADTCVAVARAQAARPEVIGMVGPYSSGCAKLMVPILSAGKSGGAVAGPLAMVSNGATDPGLTKAWDTGEPDKYYPSGRRNFARVVTTDDIQGKAAAAFASRDLGVTKVFVVNDGQVYGKHLATSFVEAAGAAGITVVGQAQWKRSEKDYRAVFAAAKAAGADAVFLGGAVTNNGIQVVKDKVAVLGDNTAVKLLAADGFTDEPELAALPEAQGMYLTFPGLSPASIRQRGGAGSQFLDAFQKKYGHDPEDPYALYGVAAAQVLLEALRRSDGTRAGVRQALFSGEGVTVPKADSVLGADIRIDPATGDVSIKDVTVQVIKRNAETFETVETVP